MFWCCISLNAMFLPNKCFVLIYRWYLKSLICIFHGCFALLLIVPDVLFDFYIGRLYFSCWFLCILCIICDSIWRARWRRRCKGWPCVFVFFCLRRRFSIWRKQYSWCRPTLEARGKTSLHLHYSTAAELIEFIFCLGIFRTGCFLCHKYCPFVNSRFRNGYFLIFRLISSSRWLRSRYLILSNLCNS